MKRNRKLNGEVAIVTGGMGTLGSQYVKTLIDEGASVAVIDIVAECGKNELIDKLMKKKSPLILAPFSVASRSDVVVAMESITAVFDTPTILINNAGLPMNPDASKCLFEDYSEDDWDATINSHIKGAHLMSQEFVREFRSAKKDHGSIINISSTYGVVGPDHSIYEKGYLKPPSYSAAKSAMIGYTKWLACYCGSEGLPIRVNALVPGGVYMGQGQKLVHEYEKRTPLGRMADQTDYNGAVLFLASQDSAYMTGSVLTVDGGWTAW